jgi:hypothetical protein
MAFIGFVEGIDDCWKSGILIEIRKIPNFFYELKGVRDSQT